MLGLSCGEPVFARELACPRCEQVLSKREVVKIDVVPSSSRLDEIGSRMLGLRPEAVFGILGRVIEFWLDQLRGEVKRFRNSQKKIEEERDKARTDAKNALAAIQHHRGLANELQLENKRLRDALQSVEQKYIAKSKSAKKTARLYDDLRGLYRRLEKDVLHAKHVADPTTQTPSGRTATHSIRGPQTGLDENYDALDGARLGSTDSANNSPSNERSCMSALGDCSRANEALQRSSAAQQSPTLVVEKSDKRASKRSPTGQVSGGGVQPSNVHMFDLSPLERRTRTPHSPGDGDQARPVDELSGP